MYNLHTAARQAASSSHLVGLLFGNSVRTALLQLWGKDNSLKHSVKPSVRSCNKERECVRERERRKKSVSVHREIFLNLFIERVCVLRERV